MPVQNSCLFPRYNSNKRKNVISQGFSVNKKSKTILSRTTIVTVVAKHNAKNIKLKSTPLHVLIDSGSD